MHHIGQAQWYQDSFLLDDNVVFLLLLMPMPTHEEHITSSSSSSSSTMDAGEMPLCPHHLQLIIITYTYYLLRITLRIGLQFQCR